MLEVYKKLVELEENKSKYVSLLKELENYYFDEGTVQLSIITKAFDSRNNSIGNVKFDKKLMMEYIKSEIKSLDISIGKIIESTIIK